MGRKAKFDETKKVKKGPGRKSRKQPAPVFKKELCKSTLLLLQHEVLDINNKISKPANK